METCKIFLRDGCKCSGALTRRGRFLFRATAPGELGIPPLSRIVRLARVCALLVALTAPSARACIIADDCDNFVPPGTADIVVRPAFAAFPANAYCDGGAPSRPFDGVNDVDCAFKYSFIVPNLCCPADLTITLQNDVGGLTSNDSISLGFNAGPPASFCWGRKLGELELETDSSGAFLCTQNSGTRDGAWNMGDDITCELDLAALPLDGVGTVSCCQAIQSVGAVDVYVQDDTPVDCLALCYDVCGIPTVSEWGLVVLTLLLLIGAKIYFGRRQTATA